MLVDHAEKQVAHLGVPWEESFGYAQAVRVGDVIYLSGQLSHDAEGRLVAPAPIDEHGHITDAANMEIQMSTTYANAVKVLAKFGATLSDVVEETLFVIDVPAAFAIARKVREVAYGVERPPVASNLIGISRLAFPEQLVEITFKAILRPTSA